jgi:hypothetical protein
MKSFLKNRTVNNSRRGFWLLRCAALAGVALASILSSASVYGQGAYYPVNPPGTLNYTGITIHSNANLQALQNKLQSLYGTTVTLQVPIPTGETAPTTAQYSATVAAVVNDVLSGLDAPYGITLASLSNEAVAWNLAARQTTAQAIAQQVITYDLANSTAAQAITDLATVTTALGISQPTNIDSIVPSILGQAQANSSTAPGIAAITTAAIVQIPTDLTRIASITHSGLAALSSANLSNLQKEEYFVSQNGTGLIYSLLTSTAATNNPSVIQTVVSQVTNSNSLSLAGNSLPLILESAEMAVNTTTPYPTYNALAAVANGALLSQSSSSATIQTTLQTYAPAGQQPGLPGSYTVTYSQYIGGVVGGYNAGGSQSAFATYVSSNPTLADAAVAGAVNKGSVTPATLLQTALTNGTGAASDPNPANIVAEAILANVGGATSTILGAINTTTHTPYGTGVTFGQVALGGAEGAQIQNIGNVVQTIVQYTASSLTALPSATVNSVVSNAIDGANNAGNSGAFGDIVYKAEVEARNTSGISASLVQTAITEIAIDGGLPYIAPIAAAAGDAYGANRSAIQGAAAANLTGNNLTAAQDGLALVQSLQTSSTTKFTATLSAFNTAAGQTDAADGIRADLYAALMANPSEYDADLAAALKQSQTSNTPAVSSTTLLADANNAIRGINASLTANLQMVDTVVTHIQNEALGVGASGVGDLFDFVTHQIVINSSLTNDIVIAATVVDPDHAHYVATAAAFQAPLTVSSSVASIFEYAQITNPHPLVLTNASSGQGVAPTGKTFPGTFGVIVDQPAAAAAITAGLTTGILEANLSTANTQTALSATVAAAVAASITQNGTNLQGPTYPFNNPGDTTKQFQQSTGASITAASGARTVGAAGAITGFVAEVTTSGQTTISSVTAAVLTAATGGAARAYALQIAQAAAQAFAWVSGYSTPVTTITGAAAGNPVYDIAEAIAPSVTGFATLTQLENAVAFGINQAEGGVIGAGALGLNATGLNAGNGSLTVAAQLNNPGSFYLHRSATGTPVTDIFNL